MREERTSKFNSKEHSSTNGREKAAEKDVEFRAYQIYLSRNRAPGHAMDDWLQAEREIVSHKGQPTELFPQTGDSRKSP